MKCATIHYLVKALKRRYLFISCSEHIYNIIVLNVYVYSFINKNIISINKIRLLFPTYSVVLLGMLNTHVRFLIDWNLQYMFMRLLLIFKGTIRMVLEKE